MELRALAFYQKPYIVSTTGGVQTDKLHTFVGYTHAEMMLVVGWQ